MTNSRRYLYIGRNSKGMDGSFRVLSVIVQSFVAFVGLSILLGRIYFLTYFETLGIPTSEVSLNVTDYSIISEYVPLICITVALIPPIIFLGFPPFQNQTQKRTNAVWALALILMCLAALIVWLAQFVPEELPAATKISVVISLISILLAPLGSALILSSGLTKELFAGSESKGGWWGALSAGLPALVTGALIAFAVLFVLLHTNHVVEALAKSDARKALIEAPRAYVGLTPSAQSNFPDVEECSTSDKCVYRVILIGDHFVYLVDDAQENTNISESSSLPTRYAVPLADLSHFTYLPK